MYNSSITQGPAMGSHSRSTKDLCIILYPIYATVSLDTPKLVVFGSEKKKKAEDVAIPHTENV
jgi:hypothetical protein